MRRKFKDVTLFSSTAAAHTAAVSPCWLHPLLGLYLTSAKFSTEKSACIACVKGLLHLELKPYSSQRQNARHVTTSWSPRLRSSLLEYVGGLIEKPHATAMTVFFSRGRKGIRVNKRIRSTKMCRRIALATNSREECDDGSGMSRSSCVVAHYSIDSVFKVW